MIRVQVMIRDPANRLTLRGLLAADGYEVVDDAPDVLIADDREAATAHAVERPALLLVRLSEVPDAIGAMRQGVFGYILAPFQPGEAGLMVQRAWEWWQGRSVSGRNAPTTGAAQRIRDAETDLILNTLRACKNNQTQAARLLGIGRNTLWRKLREIRGDTSRNPRAEKAS